MTNKEWRKLWLEIAESFDEKPSICAFGFCGRLIKSHNQYGLAKIIEYVTRTECLEDEYWLYPSRLNSPDPVRAFTACFIAEIGEAEFMALAEEA